MSLSLTLLSFLSNFPFRPSPFLSSACIGRWLWSNVGKQWESAMHVARKKRASKESDGKAERTQEDAMLSDATPSDATPLDNAGKEKAQ